MIDTRNFALLLTDLGFTLMRQATEVYEKSFPALDTLLKVDSRNQQIIYPENDGKGITVTDRTTCNFSSPENFVVLECVPSAVGQRLQT